MPPRRKARKAASPSRSPSPPPPPPPPRPPSAAEIAYNAWQALAGAIHSGDAVAAAAAAAAAAAVPGVQLDYKGLQSPTSNVGERYTCVHWTALKGDLPCFRVMAGTAAQMRTLHIGCSILRLTLGKFTAPAQMTREVMAAMEAQGHEFPVLLRAAAADDDGASVREVLATAADLEARAALLASKASTTDGAGTALHIATACDNVGAMGALLEAGAEPTATLLHPFLLTHNQLSPLRVVKSGRALSLLLSTKAPAVLQDVPAVFSDVAAMGSVDMIRSFLDAGLHPNALGSNPLTHAADRSQLDVMRMLLDAGADVDAGRERGWTAFRSACERGHVDAARMLLAAGADPMVVSDRKETALYDAARHGFIDIIKLIVAAAGSDAVARAEKISRSPLYAAIDGRHEAAAVALVEAGADPDQVVHYGPVIMSASGHNQHALVKALLVAGAKPNARNSWGSGGSPLHHAAMFPNVGMIADLLHHGADPDAMDCYGRRPFDCAGDGGGIYATPPETTIVAKLMLAGACAWLRRRAAVVGGTVVTLD